MGSSCAEPDCCVAPPASDRRPWAARRVPESTFRVAWARRSGRQLATLAQPHDYGASTERARGLPVEFKFDVGRGGSGSGPRPTVVATGLQLASARRSAALGPRGSPAASGAGHDHTECHGASSFSGGLKHTARVRCTKGVHLFFFSLSHCSWERDTGRLPGSCCSGPLSRSPYLTLKSESPGLGSCPGRRLQLGTRQQTPARLLLRLAWLLLLSQLEIRVT